jgi:predicted alpha/beta superfamily hydrolase
LRIESPSLYVAGRTLLRTARRAPRWPGRVYLGVGTAEAGREEINRETVENVRSLESILRQAGLGPKRLNVVVKEGATHSEDAWAERFPEALRFLFGRADQRRNR